MVRTLDFHSNNVGSIPASLIMIGCNIIFLKGGKKHINVRSARVSFNFISIISPKSVNNVRLISNVHKTKVINKKLLIKQSYMLLAWMYVLNNSASSKKTYPRFFIKPVSRKIFTKIKAPMAHKTFSQEQYSIRYFSIKVSIYINYNKEMSNIESVNSSLYSALLFRGGGFFFETNLMLLQRVIFSASSCDVNYMQVI